MPDARRHLEDGLRRERAGLLEAALDRYRRAASETDDPAVASGALRRQADALRQRCEWDRALEAARASADVAARAGLLHLLAEALNGEAAVHISRGEFSLATPLLQSVVSLTDEPRLRGIALGNLAGIAAQAGRLEEAQRSFHHSREYYQAAGYRRGEALALNDVGRVMLDDGDVAGAAAFLRQAIELAREVEDGELVALATLNLGEALMREESYAKAEEMASHALGFFAMSGNTWRRIEVLRLLGDIRLRRGDVQTGIVCYEQGLALAREIGARLEAQVLERRVADSAGAGDSIDRGRRTPDQRPQGGHEDRPEAL